MIKREATLPTQPDNFAVLLVTKLGDFWKAGKRAGDLTLQSMERHPGDILIIDATGPGYREYEAVMKFRVVPLSDTHIKVTAECKEIPGLPKFFLELWDEIARAYAGMITVRVISKPAKIDAPRDQWLAYYFACQQAGEKYTQSDLANDMGLAYSTARKLVSDYRRDLEK